MPDGEMDVIDTLTEYYQNDADDIDYITRGSEIDFISDIKEEKEEKIDDIYDEEEEDDEVSDDIIELCTTSGEKNIIKKLDRVSKKLNRVKPVKKEKFKKIDFVEETKELLRFQKTKNFSILEKIYLKRIPTLDYWSKKWGWLYDGRSSGCTDLKQDLSVVFVKAAKSYGKKKKVVSFSKKGKIKIKTLFNTYFFYCFDNYIKNIINRMNAHKRLPIGCTDIGFAKKILSLEHEYDGCKYKNGKFTLYDVISDNVKYSAQNDVSSNIDLTSTIGTLANHNPDMESFLRMLSMGETVTSAIRNFKVKSGIIKVSKIKKRIGKILASKLIKDDNKNSDFKIIDYHVNKGKFHYKIELDKTKKSDFILKKIMELKKNKEEVVEKIKLLM